MKKGLIALGLGFLLVFAGTEGGADFLTFPGGLFMLAGCAMVGWNLDSAFRSSRKPEPQKPSPKPEPVPEPAKPAERLCRHCGAKLEDGDIYCIECGEKQ